MLNDPFEDAPSLIKATAGEDQIKHTHPVFAPLLDLVEVPAVGVGWIVGLFVEAYYAARATIIGFCMTDRSSSRLSRSSSSSICGDDGKKWPGYIASISG